MTDYQNIKLVILDVDGTLTDGGIYYDSHGGEMKRFDVKDGLGIKVAIAAGLEIAVITGRESPMVQRRVKELGIQHLIQGVQKKAPAMLQLLKETGLTVEEIAYIGDDLNDLPAMELVGFRACPADAAEEIREICHYVADAKGGHGAVRECLEHILQKHNPLGKKAKDVYTA